MFSSYLWYAKKQSNVPGFVRSLDLLQFPKFKKNCNPYFLVNILALYAYSCFVETCDTDWCCWILWIEFMMAGRVSDEYYNTVLKGMILSFYKIISAYRRYVRSRCLAAATAAWYPSLKTYSPASHLLTLLKVALLQSIVLFNVPLKNCSDWFEILLCMGLWGHPTHKVRTLRFHNFK